MTRVLSYPAEITAAVTAPPHLYLPLSHPPMPPAEAAAYKANMARTMPWNTVGGAVRLFAAAAGEALPPPPFVDGEAVVIPLPNASVSEPWRAAVILNLVDFSLEDSDSELLLIKNASLRAPALSGLTLDAGFAALAAHIEATRAVMKSHLPADFWVDQYEKDNWPEDSDQYGYDLRLGLSRTLSLVEEAQIGPLVEDGDSIVGWMAYATDSTAWAWLDEGKEIFGGEASVSKEMLSWSAGRPPTDFAPSLLLVEAALARMGVTITKWDIAIQEGI